jgi:hypothetical protein
MNDQRSGSLLPKRSVTPRFSSLSKVQVSSTSIGIFEGCLPQRGQNGDLPLLFMHVAHQ